jgi:chemotaxis protein MotB
MGRKKKHPEHVNHERWLVSYADFITLLFAFFVVMFAVSQVDTKQVGRFTESFQQAIGLDLPQGGAGLLPGERGPAKVEEVHTKAPNAKEKQAALEKLAQAMAEAAKIRTELSGMKIVRRGNELVLRLQETVLFPSASADIAEAAVPVVRAIAEEIRDRPVRVRVEGHTDDRPISNGKHDSNWDLSTARATSVVKELARSGLLKPERLAAVGYAEFQPIGDNKTEDGRGQNRRVDFVLTLELPVGPEPEAPAPETEGATPPPPASASATGGRVPASSATVEAAPAPSATVEAASAPTPSAPTPSASAN